MANCVWCDLDTCTDVADDQQWELLGGPSCSLPCLVAALTDALAVSEGRRLAAEARIEAAIGGGISDRARECVRWLGELAESLRGTASPSVIADIGRTANRLAAELCDRKGLPK